MNNHSRTPRMPSRIERTLRLRRLRQAQTPTADAPDKERLLDVLGDLTNVSGTLLETLDQLTLAAQQVCALAETGELFAACYGDEPQLTDAVAAFDALEAAIAQACVVGACRPQQGG